MDHGDDFFRPALFRAHHQAAAGVRAAEDDQCGRFDGMLPGKSLNGLMNDIAVLQPQDKGSSSFACSIS
jgi:hypothetical protein